MTQHLPMPRATTAACEVMPPFSVKMPAELRMPWMSSAVVSCMRFRKGCIGVRGVDARAFGATGGGAAINTNQAQQAKYKASPCYIYLAHEDDETLGVGLLRLWWVWVWIRFEPHGQG